MTDMTTIELNTNYPSLFNKANIFCLITIVSLKDSKFSYLCRSDDNTDFTTTSAHQLFERSQNLCNQIATSIFGEKMHEIDDKWISSDVSWGLNGWINYQRRSKLIV